MPSKKQKTVLLVDGDTLCFRSAAAAESRMVNILHKPSGRTKLFKTRTAFKEALALRDFKFIPEDYEYEDIQVPEDLANPLHSIKLQLKKMKTMYEPDEVRIFIGGKGNFRLELPFPEIYKGQRDTMIRPVHLSDCKEFALRSLGAELIEGEEADDALIYVGYAYLKRGFKVILGSQDKDSWAYSGLHILDFTNPDAEPWLVPDLGELYVDTSKKVAKVKGSGFLWYCHQHLLGDATDNMNPRHILGIKWGEKSSLALLKDCKTKQEALDVVVGQYEEWFKHCPEYVDCHGNKQIATPEFMLQLYFRGIRMMSTPDDDLDFIKFCKKEGLKYVPKTRV